MVSVSCTISSQTNLSIRHYPTAQIFRCFVKANNLPLHLEPFVLILSRYSHRFHPPFWNFNSDRNCVRSYETQWRIVSIGQLSAILFYKSSLRFNLTHWMIIDISNPCKIPYDCTFLSIRKEIGTIKMLYYHPKHPIAIQYNLTGNNSIYDSS